MYLHVLGHLREHRGWGRLPPLWLVPQRVESIPLRWLCLLQSSHLSRNSQLR